MKHTYQALALAIVLAALAGCSNTRKLPPPTDEQNQAKTQLESQMKEAAQTAQTYHAKDNATLLIKLAEESKNQRDYFNSLAYRELKTRTNVDTNALVALVKQTPNADGLLPLLLLRQLDPKAFAALPAEQRANVLVDALKNAKYFNSWGLPNAYSQDAAKATLETGNAAAPGLRKLLQDTRPAPLYGSKEAMASKLMKYRVCDYALWLLRGIAGEKDFKLPKTNEERDALIKAQPAK